MQGSAITSSGRLSDAVVMTRQGCQHCVCIFLVEFESQRSFLLTQTYELKPSQTHCRLKSRRSQDTPSNGEGIPRRRNLAKVKVVKGGARNDSATCRQKLIPRPNRPSRTRETIRWVRGEQRRALGVRCARRHHSPPLNWCRLWRPLVEDLYQAQL